MPEHKQKISAAYLGVILIWSTTPLGIVWSGQGVHFTFPLFARMAIGLSVCLLWLTLTRTSLPMDSNSRKSYLIAGSSIWLAMLCTYWGAQFVTSGLISVLFGLSPILTGIMAWIWLHEESASPLKFAGTILGLIGLAAVFSDSLQLGENSHWGIAAVLMAVLAQAWGLVAVKRLKTSIPAVAQTAGALSVTVPLAGLSLLLLGEWPALIPTRAILATTYLGVFGSVMGFSLYYYLIKHLETGRVALVTLITPVTALLLGMVFNHEQLSINMAAGTALILLGLVLYEWNMLRNLGMTSWLHSSPRK